MPKVGYKASEEHKRKVSKALKGKKNSLGHCQTEEHKKKLSEANKKSDKNKAHIEKLRIINRGNKYSKGNKHFLGHKHTEETKLKISNIKRGSKATLKTRKKMSEMRKGANGSNWKGGITPEHKRIRMSIEYRLWREAIFTRDGFTCQKCKKKNIYLHPHHIRNFADYPELRFLLIMGLLFVKYATKNFIIYMVEIKIIRNKLWYL